MTELLNAMTISTHGMKAQSDRIRVISENVANADSAANAPGEDPYRRKLTTFKNVFDKEMGVSLVKLDDVKQDQSEFKRELRPGHPGADADGYVNLPNVNSLIEMMDMREAQRSYEANLTLVDMTRRMTNQTIGLLDK